MSKDQEFRYVQRGSFSPEMMASAPTMLTQYLKIAQDEWVGTMGHNDWVEIAVIIAKIKSIGAFSDD